MAENKVQFGLKNVHYAVLTEGSTNSWDTPVKVSGAVSLSLNAQGNSTDFYADNVTYYKAIANNGYSGSLEMARITDEMLEDIFALTVGSTDKVLYENANVEPKPFALLFEIDGDADHEMYCLYRVIATRPSANANTTTDSKEPQTQTIDISALPLATGSASQLGLVKARTTAETPAQTKNGWFTSVTVPA